MQPAEAALAQRPFASIPDVLAATRDGVVDKEMAVKEVALVFAPTVAEMYPGGQGESTRVETIVAIDKHSTR